MMLKTLASHRTFDLFDLERGSREGTALEFFICDTINIFLLLSAIIFVISAIRRYFPPEKTRRILLYKREFREVAHYI